MATNEEVLKLREYIAEQDDSNGWTDVRLAEYIDANTNLYKAAAEAWGVKAAMYAGLVNVSESGSSRSLGDLFKQAQAMREYYANKGAEEDNAELASAITIRRIRRGVA